MDFTALFTDHFVAVVVVACLVIGYIVKHATFLKWIPNDDIPMILAIVGAIVNCINGGFGLESIVYGAFMGLASTGLHQMFKKFVNNGIEDETVIE